MRRPRDLLDFIDRMGNIYKCYAYTIERKKKTRVGMCKKKIKNKGEKQNEKSRMMESRMRKKQERVLRLS